MYFGCPSVARRVGGIPEVVEENVSGLLVSSDQPDALAHAIENLIQDPKRRTAMGQAARERAVKHFSAEAIVPRYEALYKRVCR
jgi:glycosyltransferase involved in cell wall biosynthesis